jgi:hypothetical protein
MLPNLSGALDSTKKKKKKKEEKRKKKKKKRKKKKEFHKNGYLQLVHYYNTEGLYPQQSKVHMMIQLTYTNNKNHY